MLGIQLRWRRSLVIWAAIHASSLLPRGEAVDERHLGAPPVPGDRSAIVLELPHGAMSTTVLREWNEFAAQSEAEDAVEVWVLCRSATQENIVHVASHLHPFLVSEEETWRHALQRIRVDEKLPKLVGLYSSGTLPSESLPRAIQAFGAAIGQSPESSILIVSRSRLRDDRTRYMEKGEWLSDRLVAQVWFSFEMLRSPLFQSSTFMPVKVEDERVLGLISHLLTEAKATDGSKEPPTLIVDGTDLLRSSVINMATYEWCDTSIAGKSRGRYRCEPLSKTFAVAVNGHDHIASVGYAVRNVQFYISDLSDAVVAVTEPSSASNHVVGKAMWPPRYVLESVSSDEGLVIVSNVNCGYLDFALNFLVSVRRHTDAKVLFVATDEVAFEYLDDVIPGKVLMFPFSDPARRKRATESGDFGDKAFKDQVVIRPDIMEPIIYQGYAVLWTDIDIVWLGNPLPFFPTVGNPNMALSQSNFSAILEMPSAVDLIRKTQAIIYRGENIARTGEASNLDRGWNGPPGDSCRLTVVYLSVSHVLLQLSNGNWCTCLMFVRSTPVSKLLLHEWKREMDRTHAVVNQQAFHVPLKRLMASGELKLALLPKEVMPSGYEFFQLRRFYGNDTKIIHNNGIIGHDKKKNRWIKKGMWYVENVTFPNCMEPAEEE